MINNWLKIFIYHLKQNKLFSFLNILGLSIGIAGVIIFLLLLSKYTDVKRLRDVSKALVAINEDEIKIASGNFHHRKSGDQFQDPHHFYSLDIDLFGRGSFFIAEYFINYYLDLELWR